MKEELTKLIEDPRTDIKDNKREIEDDPKREAVKQVVDSFLIIQGHLIIRMKDIK